MTIIFEGASRVSMEENYHQRKVREAVEMKMRIRKDAYTKTNENKSSLFADLRVAFQIFGKKQTETYNKCIKLGQNCL